MKENYDIRDTIPYNWKICVGMIVPPPNHKNFIKL